jgi:hypothetical protein
MGGGKQTNKTNNMIDTQNAQRQKEHTEFVAESGRQKAGAESQLRRVSVPRLERLAITSGHRTMTRNPDFSAAKGLYGQVLRKRWSRRRCYASCPSPVQGADG